MENEHASRETSEERLQVHEQVEKHAGAEELGEKEEGKEK